MNQGLGDIIQPITGTHVTETPASGRGNIWDMYPALLSVGKGS